MKNNKELRIGDLVRYESSVVEVTALPSNNLVGIRKDGCNWCTDIADLSPIEISDTILRDNGFDTYYDKNNNCYVFETGEKNYRVSLKRYNKPTENSYTVVVTDSLYKFGEPIYYIHQLQHILWVIGVPDFFTFKDEFNIEEDTNNNNNRSYKLNYYKFTNPKIEKVDFDEFTSIFRLSCDLEDSSEQKLIDTIRFQFTPNQLKKVSEHTGSSINDLITNAIISDAATKIFGAVKDNFKEEDDYLTIFTNIEHELLIGQKDVLGEIIGIVNDFIREHPIDYIIPRDYDTLKYKAFQFNAVMEFLDKKKVPKGGDGKGDYTLIHRLKMYLSENSPSVKIKTTHLDYNIGDVILITGENGSYIPFLINNICYSKLGFKVGHHYLCYEGKIGTKVITIPFDSRRIVGPVGNVENIVNEFENNTYIKEEEKDGETI